MNAKVYVHESEAAFEAWLEEANKIDPASSPAVELGEKLWLQRRGCKQCHSIEAARTGTGPSWQGTYGTEQDMTKGGPVTVDENYIRESILNPMAKIRAGYKGVMPSYQGQLKDAEIAAFIWFIKSLKEGETIPALGKRRAACPARRRREEAVEGEAPAEEEPPKPSAEPAEAANRRARQSGLTQTNYHAQPTASSLKPVCHDLDNPASTRCSKRSAKTRRRKVHSPAGPELPVTNPPGTTFWQAVGSWGVHARPQADRRDVPVRRDVRVPAGRRLRRPGADGAVERHSPTWRWASRCQQAQDNYNQAFTLHGAIMTFLFIIPSIPAALGNIFLPMMLGAKDVAFPRMNLASFYLWCTGRRSSSC